MNGNIAGLCGNGPSRRRVLGAFAVAGTHLYPGVGRSLSMARISSASMTPDLRDDGSTNALAGRPQMPHLLDGYSIRPSWKVAGVDYQVGAPTSPALTHWRQLNLSQGIIKDHVVVVTQNDVVLDGVDFAKDGGAQLLVNSPGSVTVQNCRFGGASLKSIATGIIDTSTARMTIRNCTFDGEGAGNAACVVFARRPVEAALNYSHIYNFPSRVVQLLSGGSLDYRFNLVGEGAMEDGAHMNYLEFGSGVARPVVAFNTTAQTDVARSGGEGFQFYFNQGGTLHDPICVHNTMIARGGNSGRPAMSYLMHGSGYRPEITTTVVGRALVQGNLLDISSAYGAFYPGSFRGWEFHDNIDMMTRRTLPQA